MPDQSRSLARFHQVLVDEIRESRPDYLRTSFTVAEIYQNLVPYRTHRDRVGAEMNGDYEDTLLRLLAGEGGYLILDSEPARLRIQSELRSSNPNTTIYREFAAAEVRLDRSRLPLQAALPPQGLPPQPTPERETPRAAAARATDGDLPRAGIGTAPAPPPTPAPSPRPDELREPPRSPSVNPDLGLFVADLFGRTDTPTPAAAPPPPKAEPRDVALAPVAPVESAPPVVERTRAPEPVETPPAEPTAVSGASRASAPPAAAPGPVVPSSPGSRPATAVPVATGLADENARLRRIVADQALEILRLRELLDEQREA